MKKTFMMAMAAMALTFAGCGNQTKNAGEAVDSLGDMMAVSPEVQAATDSLTSALSAQLDQNDAKTLTTTLAALQAKYAELVKSGKLDEAKKYASQVQAFIKEHADKIKSVAAGNATISALVEGVKNLPTNAEATADEAAAAVKSDVKSVVDNAKATATDKANEAVENTKQAARDKVSEEVSKSQKKVDETVNKAAEKTNEAANNAMKKLGL